MVSESQDQNLFEDAITTSALFFVLPINCQITKEPTNHYWSNKNQKQNSHSQTARRKNKVSKEDIDEAGALQRHRRRS